MYTPSGLKNKDDFNIKAIASELRRLWKLIAMIPLVFFKIYLMNIKTSDIITYIQYTILYNEILRNKKSYHFYLFRSPV